MSQEVKVVTKEDKKSELLAESERRPFFMSHISYTEWAGMSATQRRDAVQAFHDFTGNYAQDAVVENHSERVTLDLRVRALEERVKDLENKHGVS